MFFCLFCCFKKKTKNKAGFKSATGVEEGNQAHERVKDKEKKEKEKNAGSFYPKCSS